MIIAKNYSHVDIKDVLRSRAVQFTIENVVDRRSANKPQIEVITYTTQKGRRWAAQWVRMVGDDDYVFISVIFDRAPKNAELAELF